MSTEYRVVWKRAGLDSKSRRYVSKVRADRLVALLTNGRPIDRPDALACCSGRECGCGGLTNQEQHDALLAEMPALEWVRVDVREVGKWCAA